MTKHIYGSMPGAMPEGYAKRVHYPILALMDVQTGDHRLLLSSGGKAREGMPLTIKTQPASSYGHEGAIPSGALFQVEFDDETGVVSADGFLLDDPMGLLTAKWVQTKAMDKNSVDLADIAARFVEIEDIEQGTFEWWVEFYQWAVAATTFVATPAFPTAHGEIVAALAADAELTASLFLAEDEIMAALLADPMEPLIIEGTEIRVPDAPHGEITADGSAKIPFDLFYRPESATPQKIVVTEAGHVYGHLGLWETCHDGYDAQCIVIPRPQDGYASFNKPGVLTDRGIVETGPIFALGGHRTLIGKNTPEEEAAAYGGIENTWCDVRVTEGVHGPWCSGVVRPGVPGETVYAARASRISGHWKGGRLKAIVSCNAEGYDVPGTGEREVVAAFEYALGDDGVSELIASFPGCMADGSALPTGLDQEQLRHALAQLGVVMAPETDASEAERLSGQLVPNIADAAAIMRLVSDDDEV